MMDNYSGHYQPNTDELKKQAVMLREAGLTTDDFHIVPHK